MEEANEVDIVDMVEMDSYGQDDHELSNATTEPLVKNESNDQIISIQRPSLNEASIEKELKPISSKMKKNWYKSFIPPEPIRSAFMPPMSRKDLKIFLFTHFPILGWLWTYRPNYIIGDLISGFTVAIMHIPQGLAYSQLAKLPPVYGLYVSFVPVLIYSIFGSSRHISVGTFAVVCLMVANAITKVFEANSELSDCLLDSSNETTVVWYNETTSCEDIKRDIAVTLSFFSGIIMILMGVFKLGFITIFLSEPLISGYTTGAAVHVFTSQIKHIFGLNITSERGLFSVPKTWIDSVVEIFGDWTSNVNNVTLIISIITIFILIIFRIVDRKLLRKIKVLYCHYSMTDKKCTTDKIQWFIPLPSQIIIVIFGTGISYAFKFNEEFNVTIVGKIPSGPPDFTPPVFYYLQYVWTDAFVISIVTFAISVSLSQVFAKQFSYSIDSGQELLAYGAMNLIGSLFKSFNSAGSLSRSTVQAVSGGKTQLVGIISSVIIFFTLLWIGRLFEQLPNAILASIIWVALYGMFSQVVDVWRYFKLSIADVSIWLVVFGATVLLGVDLGLGVGVLFSLFTIVFKLILPKSVNLGRVPDTEIYRDIDMYERVESVHGVIIYRFQAPLCFVNCKVFQLRLDLACGVSRSNYDDNNGQPGCIQVLATKIFNLIRRRQLYNITAQNDKITRITHENIHSLVLDCSPFGFMDAMGVKTLQQLVLDYDSYGIQVLLASMTKNNRNFLERVGFYQKCGKEWMFPSVQDAVEHALTKPKLHPGDKPGMVLSPEEDVRDIEDDEDENALSEIRLTRLSPDDDVNDDDQWPNNININNLSADNSLNVNV